MRDDFDMLFVLGDMRNDIGVSLGLFFWGIHIPSVCLFMSACSGFWCLLLVGNFVLYL